MAKPKKYPTPEALEAKIEDYFAERDAGKTVTRLNKKGEPVTFNQAQVYSIIDLCLFLGFSDYRGLQRYEEYSAAYRQIVSRAKKRIEAAYIHGAMAGDYNPRFAEFLLRCKFDYQDKQKIELTGKDGGPVELKKILDETDGSTRGLPKEKEARQDITSRRSPEKSTGYLPTSNDGDDPGAGEGGAGSGTDQGKPAGKSVKGR